MIKNKPNSNGKKSKKNHQNDNVSTYSAMPELGIIRTLLLFDCEATQNTLAKMMRQEKNFDFSIASTLPDCLEALNETIYDIIITDYCDRDLDADEMIAPVKQSPNNAALILLTGESCPLTEIDFLDLGADYVMPKEIETSILLARIKAIMRWRQVNKVYTAKIGPFEFRMDTRTLVVPDSPDVKFTEKEASLLKFLLLRREAIVSRADLLNYVWEYNNGVDTHTVETHIYRLRKKLASVMKGRSVILTETGGYRLAA